MSRLNVYTEELLDECEIVKAHYVSSRTGQPMTNWGLRIFMKSSPDLHYIPGRDDDRSAVTFWCGSKEKNIFAFLDAVRANAYAQTLDTWREKTEAVQAECEAAIGL